MIATTTATRVATPASTLRTTFSRNHAATARTRIARTRERNDGPDVSSMPRMVRRAGPRRAGLACRRRDERARGSSLERRPGPAPGRGGAAAGARSVVEPLEVRVAGRAGGRRAAVELQAREPVATHLRR